MSLLGKLSTPMTTDRPLNVWPSLESEQRLVGWLVGLQTSTLQEEDISAPDVLESSVHADAGEEIINPTVEAAQVVLPENVRPVAEMIEPFKEDLVWAGMTGRCNKVADTCYAFWTGGSLQILNSLHLLDQDALARYLIEKTQHRIGGFGKLPGDVPGMSIVPDPPPAQIHVAFGSEAAD
ncbi:MAG: hypothetical protein L6R37_000107 [Teloschistes peruensis]|nr:MAG: hypothetical protein L6R37_000107 [Teloschistes peruensis]